MKYLGLERNKPLPNRKLDKFLIHLHALARKHKIVLTGLNNGPLVAEPYSLKGANKMIHNIRDNLPEKENISDENEENSTENLI